jgi:SAM-dependent methyltransferase
MEPPAQPYQARQVAESFGTNSDNYDRVRPRYPDVLVERIAAASPGREFLDVGCGTGIAARQFQAAGCQVLGIDPDKRMADLARRHGLTVEVSTFEDWDDAGRTFDAVIAGMAWHWVDPGAGAAKAARVLRPGGRLALFWYVFQPPAELNKSFAEVARRVLPDSPHFHGGMPTLDAYSAIFVKAEEGIRQAAAFGEPERWRYDWDRRYTRDEWLEQVPTFGGFSRISPDVQTEVLTGLGEVIDAAGGAFTTHFSAVALTTVRQAPLPCATRDRLGDGSVTRDELELLARGTRDVKDRQQHGRDIGPRDRTVAERVPDGDQPGTWLVGEPAGADDRGAQRRTRQHVRVGRRLRTQVGAEHGVERVI